MLGHERATTWARSDSAQLNHDIACTKNDIAVLQDRLHLLQAEQKAQFDFEQTGDRR